MPIILMKNNKVGKQNPSRFQTMLQTYSNQNSVVFAYIHTLTRACVCAHTHTHTQRQMGCWNEMESQEIKLHIHTCCPKLLRSCLTLCYSMDYIPPGSSVHGIFQAKIPEWVSMPSFYLGTENVFLMFPALASASFTITANWEALQSINFW